MTMQAKGTVLAGGWQESTFHEHEGGGNLSHASVTDDYDGDVVGTGTLRYLLAYDADPNGVCRFTGMERVVGTVGGRNGSFVLRHTGTYGGDGLKAQVVVLEGCGTGELATLRGSGTVTAAPGDHRAAYTLDYQID